MDEIIFRVTPERVQGLKIGVQRNLHRIPKQVDYLAHFMVDENGEWLDEDAALAILDEHTIGELEGMFEQLREAQEEAAVPKE